MRVTSDTAEDRAPAVFKHGRVGPLPDPATVPAGARVLVVERPGRTYTPWIDRPPRVRCCWCDVGDGRAATWGTEEDYEGRFAVFPDDVVEWAWFDTVSGITTPEATPLPHGAVR